MSPYQQDVIDTSLGEFDRQAQMQTTTRYARCKHSEYPVPLAEDVEGVQLAEYQAGSDRNRQMLQAGMLQQGFGQCTEWVLNKPFS